MMAREKNRACLGYVLALFVANCGPAVAARTDPTSTNDSALFVRYSVSKVYRGPVRFPDFRKRDRAFSEFRTRIREGMRDGTNFAGHYAIVSWGCGTECVDYVIGDVATGRVFGFPLGGENNLELGLDTRPTSLLIVARWISPAESNPNLMNCIRQNFTWNGLSAVPLSKPAIVATVKSSELERCSKR